MLNTTTLDIKTNQENHLNDDSLSYLVESNSFEISSGSDNANNLNTETV